MGPGSDAEHAGTHSPTATMGGTGRGKQGTPREPGCPTPGQASPGWPWGRASTRHRARPSPCPRRPRSQHPLRRGSDGQIGHQRRRSREVVSPCHSSAPTAASSCLGQTVPFPVSQTPLAFVSTLWASARAGGSPGSAGESARLSLTRVPVLCREEGPEAAAGHRDGCAGRLGRKNEGQRSTGSSRNGRSRRAQRRSAVRDSVRAAQCQTGVRSRGRWLTFNHVHQE